MKKQSQTNKPNSVGWVKTVISEISSGNYLKALRAFERWAEKEMIRSVDRRGYEIARGVYMILTLTESSLERDFGVRWRRGRQSRKATEEICGFCLKARVDTAKLVAGARAYICDACIKECYQVVKELEEPSGNVTDKKPKPR